MIYRLLKKYLFLFLLTAVMLAGCEHDISGDSSEVTPGELPEGAIHFNTDAGMQTKSIADGDLMTEGWNSVNVSLDDDLQTPGAHASVGPSTKGAPVTGTTAPVGSLGILGYELTGGVWNTATATPNFMYNTQLIRTGSSGSYSYTYYPARYWPDNTNDKVRFFAYYPYNGNGISLSPASATGYPAITYTPGANVTDQVDLLYAASTEAVNNKTTGSAVNFALAHALARISFSFKLEAALEGTTTTVQSVEMTGLKSSGTLSLDPSAATPWTPGAGTASYTASVSNGALFPISFKQALSDYVPITTPSGYFLLLPQAVNTANTVVVAYTVNGKASTTTYLMSADTWNMGESINYQLTLPLPLPDPANCHFIAPGASLVIPVGIKGNGGDVAGTGLSVTHTAASVGIIWQTSAGLITVGTFNAGKQTVAIDANTAGITGNAVVAAYSGAGQTGNILWSWHIWVTDYDPNTPSNGAVYTYNSRTWMDRNLGATTATPMTVTTLGLLYQWGRKDPFPGSNSYITESEPPIYDADGTGFTCMDAGAPVIKGAVSASSNLANTVLNPGTFYYDTFGTSVNGYDWYSVTPSTHNNALWGGASKTTPTAKTIFDPCPAGWRVPAWSSGLSPWNGFDFTTFPWYNTSDWTSSYGRVYTSSSSTYYPTGGSRDLVHNGALNDVGDGASFWSASQEDSYGCYLVSHRDLVKPSNYNSKAFGLSVRCVQE